MNVTDSLTLGALFLLLAFVLCLTGIGVYAEIETCRNCEYVYNVRVELVTPWEAHVQDVSITAVDLKPDACGGKK